MFACLLVCLDKCACHQDTILCGGKKPHKQIPCHVNIIENSQNTKRYAKQYLSSWKGSDIEVEGRNNPWSFRLEEKQLATYFHYAS